MRKSQITKAGAVVALLAPVMMGDTWGRGRYVPPAGWGREATQTYVSYLKISGNTFCQFTVYVDQPGRGSAEAAFAAEWAQAFARTFVPGPAPGAVARTVRPGLAYIEGAGAVQDLRGNRFAARLAVFGLGDRVQSALAMATSAAVLAGCGGDWAAFIGSFEFGATGVEEGAGAARRTEAVAAQDAPEAGEFEGVKYKAPAGWHVRKTGLGLEVAPRLFQEGESLAIVLLPGKAGSSLEAEFAATWGEIGARLGGEPMRNVSGKNYDLEARRRGPGGLELLMGQGGFLVNNAPHSVRPYLFQQGERIRRLFVVSRDFRAQLLKVSTMTNPRWEREIHRFVQGLEFPGAEAARRGQARAEGAGVTGVWAGMAMSIGKLKPHAAIFFSDGSAFLGTRFPARGLAEAEPWLEREMSPREWGTWRMEGAVGKIEMPYGTVPLRMEGETLVVTTSNTPHRYVRMRAPGREGAAGRWCLAPGGPCLTLGADGRFLDEGAGRVVEHPTYPYPETPARGAGVYEMREHTLVLRYDGGPEVRTAVVGLAPGESGRMWVSFNWDEFVRR